LCFSRNVKKFKTTVVKPKTIKLVFVVHFVLDQHTELDFYSARSLKQQSAGRHVAPLGHIILILTQEVFILSS
jgi:hypothetical protein